MCDGDFLNTISGALTRSVPTAAVHFSKSIAFYTRAKLVERILFMSNDNNIAPGDLIARYFPTATIISHGCVHMRTVGQCRGDERNVWRVGWGVKPPPLKTIRDSVRENRTLTGSVRAFGWRSTGRIPLPPRTKSMTTHPRRVLIGMLTLD